MLDLLRELKVTAGKPSLLAIQQRMALHGRPASKGYLSDIFNGRKVPRDEIAVAIATALRADPTTLKQVRRLAQGAAADARATRSQPTPPAAAWQDTCGYLHQVRDIAPADGLRDRDAELAELAAFCHSDDSYLWWQAGPWAGKSALLATFALNPAPRTDVISFFITARLADQCDATAFTSALHDQLTALLGQADRTQDWRQLLSTATERAAASRRRLVLVVDGLDEDRGSRAGSGLPSIAALLPRTPAPALRVIVASRPHPPLPADVPDDHPLHRCQIRPLAPSPYAGDLARRATHELNETLNSDNGGRDILGLMTAAQGGLTPADLSDLTGQPPYTLDPLLAGVLGRTLTARTDTGLIFAHETLAIRAADRFGTTLDRHRERIHQWAQAYVDRGWPQQTPDYLRRGYPYMLQATADTTRLTELVTDPRRHDLLHRTTGGDAAALTEITTGYETLARHDPGNLLGLLRIAHRRDEVAARNDDLPVELVTIWVALDQPARAASLARGIVNVHGRAHALATLVTALIEHGDLDSAERVTADIGTPIWRSHALLELAEAAATAGDTSRAAALATAAETLLDDLHHDAAAIDLARHAALRAAIGDDAVAAELLDAATSTADILSGSDLHGGAITAIAATIARMGDQQRAEAMIRGLPDPADRATGYGRLAETTTTGASRLLDLAETALHAVPAPCDRGFGFASLARDSATTGDPQRARRLFDAALAISSAVDDDMRAYVLLHITEQAAATGEMEVAADAAELMYGIDYDCAIGNLAEGWARAGRLDAAEEALTLIESTSARIHALAAMAAASLASAPAEAELLAIRAQDAARADHAPQRRSLALTASLLAAAGHHELAIDLARSINGPRERATALIGVTTALADGGNPERALDLATAAATAIAEIRDDYQTGRATADIAAAITTAGDHHRPTTLTAALNDPVHRVDAYTAAAIALAATDPAQALTAARRAHDVADRIPDQDGRGWTLLGVIRAYAASGADTQARAAAATITDPMRRDQAALILAKAAAATGDFPAAEHWIDTITDEFIHDDAVAELVTAHAAAGHLPAAEQRLADLTTVTARAPATTALAVAYARQNDWSRAEALLDPENRDTLLIALARTAAATGHTDRARGYLTTALLNAPWYSVLPAVAAVAPSELAEFTRSVLHPPQRADATAP
ncbi:hypothetical protein AB0C29_00155 [Actinoplanes sp. NPDC048791]|uniref:hypothetical protein n=1 Tax=Actinoplanes sp. NPDC048791 TaxID=3154623 RepID=UPI0033EA69E1